MRKVLKIIAILAITLYVAHAAYAQGVQHAIAIASPYADGTSIMIDFDGQIHEYR